MTNSTLVWPLFQVDQFEVLVQATLKGKSLLANLTFMEPAAVVAMHVHGTATVLMGAVQASPFTSLFAKDQVATVLANLAAREECRASILQQDGLGFLLSLLATSPGSSPTQAEAAAAERVLKKAAIALSR